MGWGTDGGTEAARKARASAHTRHQHECPGGRVVRGNGWKSHARRCPDYLEKYGWPWDTGMDAAVRAALRESLDHADIESDQRSAAFLHAYQAEAIAEAKRRGLLDKDGRAVHGNQGEGTLR